MQHAAAAVAEVASSVEDVIKQKPRRQLMFLQRQIPSAQGLSAHQRPQLRPLECSLSSYSISSISKAAVMVSNNAVALRNAGDGKHTGEGEKNQGMK